MSDPSSASNPGDPGSTTDGPPGAVATEPARSEVGDAERIGSELADVDRALARIESGDYGNCTDCGMRLDDALLAADPTATTCPAHLDLEHAPDPVVAGVQPTDPTNPSWSSDR